MRELTVGTRESQLALIQTNQVIDQLKQAGIQNPISIKKIQTKGDKTLDVSLPHLGGGGVFLAEIQQELLNGEIDFAVHSLKDIPAELPEGLDVASIPVRADHRDALLNKEGYRLTQLPEGAVVGTSSLRRSAQLLRQRPDLKTEWIRGPIDSRIDQMAAGKYDAIVLAMAGLTRLGIGKDYITECLPVEDFVPAMGQGAIAIECRESDTEVRDILMQINDDITEKTAKAERQFLACFGEEEQAPIGGYAYVDDNGVIHLHGMVIDSTGQTMIEHEASGTDPEALAQETANALIRRGAFEIIASVKEEL